eukprot:TRINITY_DN24904_c0_g1_i1.p1 TRINITY_DN24904_c0_g1~~TRINITY_DN24904_c0_g1_i1.p1  ORF type:complete len:404 (+),score=84.87 TRINITY_DN24904_c0_g1_i1:37-1248(+)
MEDFNLEETMRKHEESLRQFRERVERDQREAGLLPAGVGLGSGVDYGGDSSAGLGGFVSGGSVPSPPMDVEREKGVRIHQGGYSGGMYDREEDYIDPFSGESYDAKFNDDRGAGHRGLAPSTTRAPKKSPGPTTPARQGKQESQDPAPVRQVPKTAHPLRVYDRVSQWARRKEQKLDEERRKNEEKKIAGCPFTPQTRSNKAPYGWEQKSGSIYGGTGRAWGYDEFVERQREARRRANEKREMTKYTGKNWTNEVTVCQEFQLGRRDRSIKSLQKPLSPPTFVPTVSEHHHLAKEVAGLSEESPLAALQGSGLPQKGLFSERISTAIIDNTMLNPTTEEGLGGYASMGGKYSDRMPSSSPNFAQGAFSNPVHGHDSEWAKRRSEKQTLEAHLGAHTTRPWRSE